MANQPTDPLVRFIRHLVETQRCDALSDQDLLQRYATKRDEAAFASLVRRYGPRLLRICQRVLHNYHDAEDVCQAAFLVLASKAGSRRWQSSVSYWLYKVAFHLALEAKESAARQRASESRASVRQTTDTVAEIYLHDAEAAFHEELARLPDRLRQPVALCHLEGQTRDQAAQQLGWSLGTFKRRLAQALKILHARLDRRGIALSTALLTIGITEGTAAAAIPAVWIGATVRAAMQFTAHRGSEGAEVVSQAAAWAQGALHTMFVAKVKLASLLLTALLVVGAGGMAAHQKLYKRAGESPPQAKKSKRTIEQPSQPAPQAQLAPQAQAARVDLYGDPLPTGAVARLGTVRFRHSSSVGGTMTFTPDGKALLLATAGPPLLWDVASGKLLRRFGNPARNRFYKGVRLSPDGNLVAARLLDKEHPPGGISVWETATGKVVRHFADRRPDDKRSYQMVLYCAFSPDSKTLAAQCGNDLVLWEIATGRQVWKQPDPDDAYKHLAFSPDGRTIASSKKEDGVRLWNAHTGQPLRALGLLKRVNTVTFSADSGTLFVGYGQGSVYLWDVATGKELKHLEDGKFISPTFSPDGKTMAVLDSYVACSLCLWDVAAGKEIHRCENGRGTSETAFSPDGKTIAGRTGSTIQFWEVATGKRATPPRWRGHDQKVSSVAFIEGGKTLISGGDDSTVRFWDLPTSQARLTLEREDASQPNPGDKTAIVSSDGTMVAATWVDKAVVGKNGYSDLRASIRIWDTKTGRALHCWQAREGVPLQPVFSPDNKILAAGYWKVGSDSGVTCLWEIASGKPRERKFPGVFPRFSPDGTLLLTWEKSKYNLWDVATGKKLTSIENVLSIGSAAMFSPRGDTLAIAVLSSSAVDKTGFFAIYLYPVHRSKRWGVQLGPHRIITVPANVILRTLTFSPDGKMLAAGGGGWVNWLDEPEIAIYLWETASGKERARFPGHDYPITCLAFSPDGRRLASGCEDSTILLWDITGHAQQDRLTPVRITKRELETLWEDLANPDAAQAGRAIWNLITAGPQFVSWCQARLQPVPPIQAATVTKLIADLENNDFAVRQQAQQKLQALGEITEPSLRQVLEGQHSLELRRGVEQLLAQLEAQRATPAGEALRGIRAIEVLEHIGSREARQCLEVLSAGAPGVRITEEAKAAVARLSRRKSQ